jgi:hypothetical protein
MTKLIYSVISSLDGYFEDAEGKGRESACHETALLRRRGLHPRGLG